MRVARSSWRPASAVTSGQGRGFGEPGGGVLEQGGEVGALGQGGEVESKAMTTERGAAPGSGSQIAMAGRSPAAGEGGAFRVEFACGDDDRQIEEGDAGQEGVAGLDAVDAALRQGRFGRGGEAACRDRGRWIQVQGGHGGRERGRGPVEGGDVGFGRRIVRRGCGGVGCRPDGDCFDRGVRFEGERGGASRANEPGLRAVTTTRIVSTRAGKRPMGEPPPGSAAARESK